MDDVGQCAVSTDYPHFRWLWRLCFWLAAVLLVWPAHAAATDPTVPLVHALIPEQPSWARRHPCIVLDEAGVAQVKKRIHDDPEAAKLWSDLQTRCDSYLDPHSPSFLDTSKAFSGYLKLAGAPETHENQAALEFEARKWLTPLDLLEFAYAVAGDDRYGRKVVELALATARHLTPAEMTPGFFYTRTFAVRSMALALDWCYAAFSSDERQIIRQSLIDHTNEIYDQSLKSIWGQSTLGHIWNWNGGLASAGGLGALVLDGETHAPTRQWLFQAARNVEDYLRYGVDAQGAGIEGPSYFGYGAGCLPFFLEGFKTRTGEDLYASTHYNRFADWLPFEMLPGGKRVNNIEDSDYTAQGDSLIYALHRESDRPLARFLWEQLLQGNPGDSLPAAILWAPEKLPAGVVADRSAKLPDYGWAGGRSLVVSRSGWGPDDTYFSLHAQHYTAIKHDQADKGQFTLYAYGDDLAIDSGYGNDSSTEKSISGFAHNQVLVDGHPELMGGGQAQTDGWVVDSLHTTLGDLTCLDIADAYRFFYKGNSTYEEAYQQDFLRADRQAFFVRTPFPYAVVFDDVKKDDQAHAYTWLLHAHDGKEFVRAGDTIDVVPRHDPPEVAVLAPLSDKSTPAGAGKTEWQAKVEVPKAGRYRVWGLTGTANPAGDKSNSFFLRINRGKQGFSQGTLADLFTWSTHDRLPLMWMPLNDNNGALQVPALAFNAGTVALELFAREAGADCAGLALVPEEAPPPVQGHPLPTDSVVVRAGEGVLSGDMKREEIRPPPQRAWLQVRFLTPERWQMQTDDFQTTREGVHPRLSVTMQGIDGQFLTLLVPHPLVNEIPGEASNIQPVPAQKGHAGQLSVAPGLTDLIACWDGEGIAAQDIATDAELLWMRRDAAGKIVGAAASNVSQLTLAGRPVFTSNRGKTCFVLDGATVQVPSDADINFALPGEKIGIEKVKRPTDWFSAPPRR